MTASLFLLILLASGMAIQAASLSPSESILIPDSTFGQSGIAYPNLQSFYETSSTVLQASNNKLLVVDSFQNGPHAQFGIVRYTAAGVLDSSFGSGGMATGDIADDSALAAVQQPDGKIIVVGTSFQSSGSIYMMQMIRFQEDGAIDTQFGTNGVVQTAVSGCSEATAVAVQPDDKILLAGCLSDNDFALLRFMPNGSPDSGFGTNGAVTTTVGSTGKVMGLLLQDDGSIVLAGRQNLTFRTLLIGYTNDGQLDNTFGSGGMVNIQASTQDVIETAVLQSDGKIILAGKGFPDGLNPSDVVLMRFNPNGTLDNTFGTGGITLSNLGGPMGDGAKAITVQADGKLLVAGWTAKSNAQFEPHFDLVILQYLANGTLDSSYGAAGWASIDLHEQSTMPHDLLLLASGKIVVAGTQENQTFLLQLLSFSADFKNYLSLVVNN